MIFCKLNVKDSNSVKLLRRYNVKPYESIILILLTVLIVVNYKNCFYSSTDQEDILSGYFVDIRSRFRKSYS